MRPRRKDYFIAICFLMPALALIVCFIVYPVLDALYLSFRSWKGIFGTPKVWVGLENYVGALTNSLFWDSLMNSFWFIVGGFLVLMPLSFALALLITSKLKFTRFMKTAYFMPVILGTTTVALMWTYILNPEWGAIAEIFRWLGLDNLVFDWLSTPTLNVWCVVLVNEWMYAGYNMLIFAAGLVAIPQELHDAALIDGCGRWQKIRYITLPLCKNSFKIFSVLCVTGCLKVFDIVWAMTRGGPNNISSTPAILLYTQAFQYKLFGRSSAYSIILLLAGVCLSLIMNRIFRQEDDLYM